MVTKLWIPYGLYLETFAQVRRPWDISERIAEFESLDPGSRQEARRIDAELRKLDEEESRYLEQTRDTPQALLDRVPVAQTAYGSAREMSGRPDDILIVDVHRAPADDRLCLIHTTVDEDLANARLTCNGQQVFILPAFENLDVLVRAGQFMAAAIELLGIEVPKTDPKNLYPLRDLFSWWYDKSTDLPGGVQHRWTGSWIEGEFDRRRDAIENNLKLEPPRCYWALLREIMNDRDLTRLLCKEFSMRPPYGGDARGAIEPILCNVAHSAFRNGEKWAEECKQGTWFGKAQLHASNLAKRELSASRTGRRTVPGLPLEQGKRLLQAASNVPDGSSPILQSKAPLKIEDVLCGVQEGEKKTFQLAEAYCRAKDRAATARYYLVPQTLQSQAGQRPTFEQFERGIIGLSRAIDAWVEDSYATAGSNRKTCKGEFIRFATARIVESLTATDWEPKHDWDRTLLEQLTLHGSAEVKTEQLGDHTKTKSTVQTCDPSEQMELRERLEELMARAELSSPERDAILRRYREPSSSDDDMTKTAFKKLTRAAKSAQHKKRGER